MYKNGLGFKFIVEMRLVGGGGRNLFKNVMKRETAEAESDD